MSKGSAAHIGLPKTLSGTLAPLALLLTLKEWVEPPCISLQVSCQVGKSPGPSLVEGAPSIPQHLVSFNGSSRYCSCCQALTGPKCCPCCCFTIFAILALSVSFFGFLFFRFSSLVCTGKLLMTEVTSALRLSYADVRQMKSHGMEQGVVAGDGGGGAACSASKAKQLELHIKF